jgi:hypothetical protein
LSPCLLVFAIGLELGDPDFGDLDLDLDFGDFDLDLDFGDFDLDLDFGDFDLEDASKSANVSLPLSIIYYTENKIYYFN